MFGLYGWINRGFLEELKVFETKIKPFFSDTGMLMYDENEVLYSVENTLRNNHEFLEDYLYCRDEYIMNKAFTVPRKCFGLIGQSEIVVLGSILLPKSALLWEEYYPDHCQGSTVFFAGLERSYIDGSVYWRPLVLVVCRHHEHGESPDELAGYKLLSDMIMYEAFDDEKIDYVSSTIILLDPVRESFIMRVDVETCSRKGILFDDCSHSCMFKKPRMAMRVFSKRVRRQLGLGKYSMPVDSLPKTFYIE